MGEDEPERSENQRANEKLEKKSVCNLDVNDH